MAVVKNRGAGSEAGRWQRWGEQNEVIPLSLAIREMWNCCPWDSAGHRDQTGILRAKLVPWASTNLWKLPTMSPERDEQHKECVHPTPHPSPGIQEEKFLIWMHFCSSSPSLVLQLSNALPIPPQKWWLCNIYCGLSVHWWKMAILAKWKGKIASLILGFAQGLGVGQCSWMVPLQKDTSDGNYSSSANQGLSRSGDIGERPVNPGASCEIHWNGETSFYFISMWSSYGAGILFEIFYWTQVFPKASTKNITHK